MLKEKVVSSSNQVASHGRAPKKTFTLTLSQQKMDQLVAGISDPRDKALVLFLRDSGLRVGELVMLDRDMISVCTGVLPGSQIATAATGSIPIAKSHKRRKFYVSARAFEALSLYLENREDTEPALFAGRSGERLRADQVRKLIHGSCDRLGLKRFPLHEFRRSLATRFLEGGGCNMVTLQAILEYSIVASTVRMVPR
jgi:integrase/recombinase XerC